MYGVMDLLLMDCGGNILDVHLYNISMILTKPIFIDFPRVFDISGLLIYCVCTIVLRIITPHLSDTL